MRHKLIDKDRACFLAEVAERVYGVDPFNGTRNRDNVNARAAISVLLIADEERYESVAAFFNKDYSSIIHLVKRHPERLEFDKEYRDQYQKFIIEIGKPVNIEEYTLHEIRGQVRKFTKQLAELNYNSTQIFDFWNKVITEAKKNKIAVCQR